MDSRVTLNSLWPQPVCSCSNAESSVVGISNVKCNFRFLILFLQPTCEPFDEVQFEAKDWATDKWRGNILHC